MNDEPEPWDVANAERGGSVIMIVGILAIVVIVMIIGHIILFAVGALP